jgi:hypothetical protein
MMASLNFDKAKWKRKGNNIENVNNLSYKLISSLDTISLPILIRASEYIPAFLRGLCCLALRFLWNVLWIMWIIVSHLVFFLLALYCWPLHSFSILLPFLFHLALSKFSEAIIDYCANKDNAPDKSVSKDRFEQEIGSAFDILFN